MDGLYYDLHIHSCLSPCGDMDMTPCNIANMAMLNGLSVAALTDHNSVKNCPAFMLAAEQAGIIGIPGMELTTSEEIHVLCLFPSLEMAEGFDSRVYHLLPGIKNRPDIFGHQCIMGPEDQPLGEEEKLLINATGIGLMEVSALAEEYQGLALPAHIDRHANGVLAILGDLTEDMGFRLAEVSSLGDPDYYKKRFPFLTFLRDSDAHDLCSIQEQTPHNRFPAGLMNAPQVIRYLKETLANGCCKA